MKEHYLTILRNEKTNLADFRIAAEQLTHLLAAEASKKLISIPSTIRTPLGSMTGQMLVKPPVMIPILRSGLAMLPSFLLLFPDAPIGFFGMQRDEVTLNPHLYYENLPNMLTDDKIFLLDPILATGRSIALAIQKLLERNISEENIIYNGILASKEGVSFLTKRFPKVKQVIAAIDDQLNKQGYIYPGLGDFGNRFFGTI
jgi:uracil phosphoribosyltransferase